jgi:cysteine desulfurase / selenocysteine lyase
MSIYLDNSATSFPKPAAVVKAMSDYLNNYAASPGRSAHALSVQAARAVFETRELLASFFNLDDSERVIFTANATLALNMAIKGVLKQGDHVIISHMEHNSVHRPLRWLERQGLIELSVVSCDKAGYMDLEELKTMFRPNTKMLVAIHGSNVSGAVQPIREIGHICRQHNCLFLLDAAQTAGFVPIDMQSDCVDILAFTGHKKLYGPPGIGGLCVGKNILIETFVHGGSGSHSELDTHPTAYPDRLEAGTPNSVGIIGLQAGLRYVLEKGLENIRLAQLELTQILLNGLIKLDKITLYGPENNSNRLPLVSINAQGMVPSELARRLDSEYGVMVRAGLHCSPLAHKTIGSFPQGTVRFSIGAFNTAEDIQKTIAALNEILY